MALTVVAPGGAHANGRFPRAERLLEDPGDHRNLVLAATYGLLVTRDGGNEWRHVCEAAFADPGLQTDPVVALLPDGTLLTSIFSGLSRSVDGACDFKETLGQTEAHSVPDFTVDADGVVLAALVSTDTGVVVNRLHESRDGGRRFQPLGPALPQTLRLVATLDAAPSDPKRLYVSGLGEGGVGVLLRSDDRGESFRALALPTDAASDEVPYIAAVDPTNPDALWVRTDVWKYDELAGIALAADALFYSSDGGEHFTELVRASGKLFGFALSPDGETVLAGYGDPVEGGGRFTDVDALGIYRGAAGGGRFEKVFAGAIGCLTWTATGVFACTSQGELGFALGVAEPGALTLERASPFTPALSLLDVQGPLECPGCATGARCHDYWEATCAAWGRTDCVPPSTPPAAAGACLDEGGAGGESAAASGGTGAPSATVDGGSAHGPQATAGSAEPRPTTRSEADCGCRAAPSSGSPWALGVLALLGYRAASAAGRQVQKRRCEGGSGSGGNVRGG